MEKNLNKEYSIQDMYDSINKKEYNNVILQNDNIQDFFDFIDELSIEDLMELIDYTRDVKNRKILQLRKLSKNKNKTKSVLKNLTNNIQNKN